VNAVELGMTAIFGLLARHNFVGVCRHVRNAKITDALRL
jgi:hypothetical protein